MKKINKRIERKRMDKKIGRKRIGNRIRSRNKEGWNQKTVCKFLVQND